MTVTRDPHFPAEIAELFQLLNHCCEGHSPFHVIEASANLLIAAIGFYTKEQGGNLDNARTLAAEIAANLVPNVLANFDRQSEPLDVVVPHGN